MKNKYFTKKRVMSLLLSVLMVTGMVPLSVFSAFADGGQATLILPGATDTGDGGTDTGAAPTEPVMPPADSYPCAHHTAHDAACGYVMAGEGTEGVPCGYICPVCPVQALIDALPETVSAENAESVAAQLTAIDEAKKSLTDAEVAMLDTTRYVAAAAALGSVYDAAPAADYAATVTVDGVTNNCTYLSTAINAIGAGKTGTITLLRDVEVDETLTIDSGKNITLTGGYTISLESEVTDDLVVVNNASLTLENVSLIVDYYSYSASAITIGNKGAVIVNSGGKLNGGGSDVAVYVGEGCTLTVNDGGQVGGLKVWGGGISNWYGTVTINGGTVKGVDAAAINNCGDSRSVLNITGGTITCSRSAGGVSDYVLYNKGNATLTGGTFVQNTTYNAFDMDTPVNISGNVVVQGGSIGGAVNVIGALGADASIQYTSLADGEVIAVGTDTYTLTESDSAKFISGYPTYTTHVLDEDNNRIVTKRYVASVTPAGGTATYYTSIDEAVSAANSNTGCTLKMLYDVAVSSPVVITTDCTIDLNGKTISCAGGFSGNYLLQVKEFRRKLTITDTSSAKNGVIDSGSLSVALYVGYETTSTYDNENSVTLQYGTVKGGVKLKESTSFSMTGGAINASNYYGIDVSGSNNFDANVVSIEGGTIYASRYAIYCSGTNASITISGGTFSCDKDIWAHDDVVTISGGTFTGGISVTATTLANCLAEGKAYYIGGYMQTIDEDDTGFTGADVTVGDAPVTTDKLTTLYVGSTCVVDNNVVKTTSGAGWSYDPATGVLTLTNANITTTYQEEYCTSGIYANGGSLTISTVGENTVAGGTHGIHVIGKTLIDGSGCLTVGGSDLCISTNQFTLGANIHFIAPGGRVISGTSVDKTSPYYIRTSSDGSFTQNGNITAEILLTKTYFEYVGGDTGENGHLTYTNSGDSHALVCKCSTPVTVVSGESCSGSAATCKEKALCEVCGYEYGDLADHIYGDDNICDVCEAVQPVASVTVDGVTENYSSLSAAVTAANEAGGTAVTLTLLNNVALDTTLELTGTYTLDLNGFVVDAGGNLIFIQDGGSVVITDSSDSQAGAVKREGDSALCIYSASLTVEKGSYVCDIAAGSDAVLLIKGGSFDGCIRQTYGKSVVTVEGGSFTNDDFSIFYFTSSEGELYITGGTFDAKGKAQVSDVDIYTSSQVKIAITGGTFVEGICIYGRVTLADALGDGYAYLADGEEVLSSELPDIELPATDSVTVGKATKIISVTTSGGVTTYYPSVAAAVEFANSNYGCTVKLLQSTATATRLKFTQKCTFDLNDKTLSCSSDFDSDAIIAAVDGGSIIIQGGGTVLGEVDVHEGSTITLKDAKLTGWVYIFKGTFNMESGEIVYCRTSGSDIVTTAHDSAIYAQHEGTVNITGGKITGANIGVEYYSAYVDTLNVSGGTFDCTIDFSMSAGDNVAVTGGEFIDGITVYYAKLNTVLGAGYAYFVNGEEQYDVSDDANTLEGDTVTVELHVHSYTNGFCPCGKYEAPKGSGTAADPYLIANAGQLYWFYEVTSTDDGYDGVAKNAAAHAKLTADIDTNPGSYVYEGTMTGSATPRSWEPIRLYNGTFDGDGHTVRGLHCRASSPGLFAEINTSGVVKNLGVIHSIFDSHGPAGAIACVNNYGTVSNCFTSDSAVHGANQVGGIVGINYGTVSNCFTSDSAVHGPNQVGGIVGINYGTVEDCLNSSIVMGTGYFVGGIAGYNYGGAISRCGNTGSVMIDGADGNNAGGIAGCNYGTAGIITDCYNRGSVTLNSGKNLVGGIAGANSDGDIINCYNSGAVSAYNDKVSDITGDNSGYVANCYYLKTANSVGIGTENNVSTVTAKDDAAFTSGEVTWNLNGQKSEGVWKQTLDGESYPGFAGGTVYRCFADCRGNMGYANTYSDAIPPHSFTDGVCTNKLVDGSTCGYECPHSSYENHICTVCGMPCAHEEYTDGVCDDCGLVCTHDSVTGSHCDECSCLIQASLTMNGTTTYYISAQDAVEAAKQSTDKGTTLKLLSDVVTSADDGLVIWRGTFTIDLAGRTLSGAVNGIEVSDADITVIDSGTGGRISGSQGIYATNATVTFAGGTVTGDYAIYLNGSDLTVSGGSVEGIRNAVSFSGGSVNVTGGSLEGDSKVFYNNTYKNMDVPVLSGGTFPDGISAGRAGVEDPAVNELLADGYRYWQDGNLLYVSELATSINGAVTVAPCDHSDGIPDNYTDNLDGTHTGVYNCCGLEEKEGHSPQYYTDDTAGTITQKCCFCGGDELVFTLVIPTGTVYGDPALAPHFECSDESYAGESPVITIAGKTLAAFVPAAGTYDVVMTLGGNTVSGDYTIRPKALTEDDVIVTLDKDSFIYNGNEQTPTVIVTVDGKPLTESTDYVLGFTDDSTNVGGKTVAIAFMGNYSGTATADYAITAKELTVVSVEAANREYDGTAVVKITDITVRGIVGSDEVSVAVEGMSGALSAADADTYDEVTLPTLTIYGAHAGNYTIAQPTSPVSTDVTITPCDITGATVKSSGDLTYTGAEQTQIVLSVTTDSGLEVPLTDITITGDKATNVGWYELTITADIDSNFTGQIDVDWAILPEDISHLTTDNVTSDDEDLLRDVKEAIANAEVNSSEQQKMLDDIADKCDELLDRIEEATDATATDNVGAAGTVTPDNVTEDDRAALEGAIDDLEDALDKYEGNYTDEERQLIEDFIEEKQAALDVLDDVKELKDIIENLPDPSTVEPDDIDVLEDYLKAQDIYKQLNDNGKSMLTEAETKKLADTAAALVNYKLTLGDGGTWQKDSGKDLQFTANGAYSKFVSVKVDGKVVASANYAVESGSTVVTLKAAYLQGLKTGKHSISITYPDGSASGSFTVKAAALPEGTPDTGDNAKPWLWGILAAAAIGAIVLVVVTGKKSKKK